MIKNNRRNYSRKSLVLVLSFQLLSICCGLTSSSHSQGFSIWADEQMNYCEVMTEAPYQAYNFFVFVHPSGDGAIRAEYKMIGPEGHIFQSITPYPVVSGTTGVWHGAPGINVVFASCQTQDFPIVVFLMIAPTTTPGAHWIYSHDDTDIKGIAICSAPNTLIDAFVYTCLTFNTSCWNCNDFIATSETSWGAIKSMYQ